MAKEKWKWGESEEEHFKKKEVTSAKAQRKKESLRKIERSLRMDRGEQGWGRHEMRNRRQERTRSWKYS